MKLLEALEIIRESTSSGRQKKTIGLICGFSPLHLQSFLTAHLQLLFPHNDIDLQCGLYGDFWGNLQKVSTSLDRAIVVLEWSDLDPRLGLRNLGSWAPSVLADIVQSVQQRATQFRQLIVELATEVPVSICFPTLPIPPVDFGRSLQAGSVGTELRAEIAALATNLVNTRGVTLLNSQHLDILSPPHQRLDVKSELASGFPYKLPHASIVAELLAKCSQQHAPKKGLITDLDDTLWMGILGEDGVEGISWDLEHHSHLHGMYQRFLQTLSQSGVLIGVASKNDPSRVAEAFCRPDLIVSEDLVFPIDAHWGAKSESVSRIIQTWNVGSDAVVFIDDSPMELAEVKASHPEVECILFPKDNPQSVYDLLFRLRDLFGKERLSQEDAIRSASLRRTQLYREGSAQSGGPPEQFLAQAEAKLTLDFSKNVSDSRPLELINKTNQFNLNGRRFSEASWRKYLGDPNSIAVVVQYQDKYGPLGKIAVLAGTREETSLVVDCWVMSCRAFSRRVEHRVLQELFERFQFEELIFKFEATSKNSPIRDFLGQQLGAPPGGACRLSRDQFTRNGALTSHRVLELTNG